ncbi:MAG: hypothetical protein EBR09_00685 [Proteobacteria bacterium]|nr:hypothetical protein [Pseudomonadota bacterium]
MKFIPDRKISPSGNRPERPAEHRRPAGLLFSGLLIAVSLLAFVLPLAAYHVAQVASVLRVRTSIFLLIVVSLGLYFLGILSHQPVFAMAGTSGLLSAPLLVIVLLLRSRQMPVWWALAILSLPVALLLSFLLQVPQGFNLEEWVTAELARLPVRPDLNKEQILQQLKSSAALEPLQRVFNLTDWQRLAWFLFSEAGALSLSLLASLFGTLALIDYAFTQGERIRSIISYVLERGSEFPAQMVGLLTQTQESMTGIRSGFVSRPEGSAAPLSVVSHSKVVPAVAKPTDAASGIDSLLRSVLRDPVPPSSADLLGYRFRFAEPRGWNFRAFDVPIWASVPSLGLLVYLSLLWKGDSELSQWLPAAPLGVVLVWGAFAALAVLTALAVQGAVVIHARMKPLAGLFLILFVLVLVSAVKGGALTLVAALAALGLLDNAYDFRKRLAKSKNAV